MTLATTIFPARIGLGTWKMGESAARSKQETAAVAQALEIGYRLIDTAEMYGSGGAERVIGAALQSYKSRRQELCIVSKVLPQNASYKGTVKACEASLARLGCDYLDLYLLHWRGSYPFTETLQAFAELQQRGLIRRYGVSNFDIEDWQEWQAAEGELGLANAACVNQVYYCTQARGIEFDLLPWQKQRGIEIMAYSPLGLGDLAHHPVLAEIGAARGATAAQVALAWAVRYPEVAAIPKSANPVRLKENLQAANIRLTAAELARIDRAFPAPRRKQALQMI